MTMVFDAPKEQNRDSFVYNPVVAESAVIQIPNSQNSSVPPTRFQIQPPKHAFNVQHKGKYVLLDQYHCPYTTGSPNNSVFFKLKSSYESTILQKIEHFKLNIPSDVTEKFLKYVTFQLLQLLLNAIHAAKWRSKKNFEQLKDIKVTLNTDICRENLQSQLHLINEFRRKEFPDENFLDTFFTDFDFRQQSKFDVDEKNQQNQKNFNAAIDYLKLDAFCSIGVYPSSEIKRREQDSQPPRFRDPNVPDPLKDHYSPKAEPAIIESQDLLYALQKVNDYLPLKYRLDVFFRREAKVCQPPKQRPPPSHQPSYGYPGQMYGQMPSKMQNYPQQYQRPTMPQSQSTQMPQMNHPMNPQLQSMMQGQRQGAQMPQMPQMRNPMQNPMQNQMAPQMGHPMSPQIQNQMRNPMQNQRQNPLSPQMQNQMPHQMGLQMPNQMQNQMPNQMANQMSNQMSPQMPNQMQNQMPNQMANQMPNQMSPQMPNQMQNQRQNPLSPQMQNPMQNPRPNQMPNQMQNQMSHPMSPQIQNPMQNQMQNQMSHPMSPQIQNPMQNSMQNQMGGNQMQNQIGGNQIQNSMQNQMGGNQMQNQMGGNPMQNSMQNQMGGNSMQNSMQNQVGGNQMQNTTQNPIENQIQFDFDEKSIFKF